MVRTQVYYKGRGTMLQDEDWWYLDQADDGQVTVVHSWSNTPLDLRPSDDGEQVYSLEDGLKVAPSEAARKIREILGL